MPVRWEPSTEADVSSAVIGGLLEETHYLELKRDVPPGAGANKELARDRGVSRRDGADLIATAGAGRGGRFHIFSALVLFCVLGASACGESWETVVLPVEDVALEGSRTVVATVLSGGCERNERLVIRETDEEVIVTASAQRSSGDCDDIGRRKVLRAQLEQAVGGRNVRAGA